MDKPQVDRRRKTPKGRVLARYPHCMVLKSSGYNPDTYPKTSTSFDIISASSIPPGKFIGAGKTLDAAWADAAKRLSRRKPCPK